MRIVVSRPATDLLLIRYLTAYFLVNTLGRIRLIVASTLVSQERSLTSLRLELLQLCALFIFLVDLAKASDLSTPYVVVFAMLAKAAVTVPST